MVEMKLINLRCEYEVNPIGIQKENPLLSWQIESAQCVMQSHYRIVAASSEDNLKAGVFDLWDSGKVCSGKTYGIPYEGRPLKSACRVFWMAKSWSDWDEESEFSGISWFETGLYKKSDWKGIWLGFLGGMVGNGLLMRHPFETEAKQGARARAYVCCAGYYEFHLNGKVIGEKVLDPASTDTSKTVLYSVYDVTQELRSGKNVMGFVLGTGFAGFPRILFQMNIEYADGSVQEVFSTYGESWVVSRGPIVYNALYDGEDYDARMERKGWDTPEYEDRFILEYQRPGGWIMATVVEDPGGERVAEIMPPIVPQEEYVPKLVGTFADGTAIYDAGCNITGWVRIEVRGEAGAKVALSFAEVLDENGRLERRPLRTARCEDHYTLRGDSAPEIWEPRFTYHGFRFFSVKTEGAVQVLGLTARFVHMKLRANGTFTSDLELFNRIEDAMRRTDACNFMGIPTDCAQRDERHGWATDPTSHAEAAPFFYDVSGFFIKWLRDLYDSQDEKGYFSDTAPYRWGWRPNDPQANIGVGMPLLLYRMYADRRDLEAHYDDIWKYIHCLLEESEDWMISRSPYGEWACPKDECTYEEYGPGANPKRVSFPFVSTTFFYYTLLQTRQMAELLGKEGMSWLTNLTEVVRGKINADYFDPETNQYDQGTQSANAMAVAYGLADPDRIPAIVQNIVEDIREHDWHFTTGSVGTKAVIQALCENGYEDVACKVMSQTTSPGFGYMITHGATTIWERWEAEDNNNIMNSRNQPMFVQAAVWFYKYLGGLRPGCGKNGEQTLTVFPLLPEGLGSVDVSMDIMAGRAACRWRKEDGRTVVEMEVPANQKARAVLLKKYGKHIAVHCLAGGGEQPAIEDAGERWEAVLLPGKYQFILTD